MELAVWPVRVFDLGALGNMEVTLLALSARRVCGAPSRRIHKRPRFSVSRRPCALCWSLAPHWQFTLGIPARSMWMPHLVVRPIDDRPCLCHAKLAHQIDRVRICVDLGCYRFVSCCLHSGGFLFLRVGAGIRPTVLRLINRLVADAGCRLLAWVFVC